MGSATDVLKSIVKIWHMCTIQEALFKRVMGLEGPISLRKSFCTGYLVSIIFRSDLGSAYDDLKSPFNSSELLLKDRNEDPFPLQGNLRQKWVACEQMVRIQRQCQDLLKNTHLREPERVMIGNFLLISQGLNRQMEKYLKKAKSFNI